MRILITGSRDWYCPALAESVLNRLIARYGPDLVIVHGACETGVDKAFAEACEDVGIEQEPHPADWSQGKAAGPRRNREMVSLGADLCIGFSPNLAVSRGTLNCMTTARNAGIPTWYIATEKGKPVYLWP